LTELIAGSVVGGLGGLQVAGIALVVFAAALLRGFSGFGSSLLMVPVLALVIGPKTAVAVSTLLEALATAMLLPANFVHADRRTVLTMSPATVAAIPFGHLALLKLDPSLSNLAISAAVTIMAALVWSGTSLGLPRGAGGQIGTGLASGFLTGFGSIGGPPLVLYILSGTGAAIRKRAEVIVVAGISQIFGIFSMVYFGVLDMGGATGALLLAPIFFGGGVLGAWLFRQASERTYQRVALGALLVAAVALMCMNLVKVLG